MNKRYKIKNISLMEKELQQCIECSACTKECIMLEECCDTPKKLMESVLVDKEINGSIPFSCNLCGKCQLVCPKNINMGRIFMNMRKEITAANGGRSPIKAHNPVHVHQQLGFSKLFSQGAQGTNIKRVFLPGCSLSAYSPRLVTKAYQYLSSRLPDTKLILQCCGKPTESIGETERFNIKYKLLEKMIEDSGAEEVITACQSCYKLISEKSPKYKVKSLWTVLGEIGIPETSKSIGKDSDLIFSIHDSCPTRYNKELQDSVRYIIRELGYQIMESEISRENTNCCGMGGMVMPVNHELFSKISMGTSEKLDKDHVITYCASCREAMVMSGKKSVHLLDLVFNSCYKSSSEFPDINKAAPLNWVNRYKTKRMAGKENGV